MVVEVLDDGWHLGRGPNYRTPNEDLSTSFILAPKAKPSTRCDTKSHRKELNLRVQFTEPMPGHLMHRATDLEAI